MGCCGWFFQPPHPLVFQFLHLKSYSLCLDIRRTNLDTGNKVHIKQWFQAEFTMNDTSKFFNSVATVRLSFKNVKMTSHHFLADLLSYILFFSPVLVKVFSQSSHCSLQSCNFSLSSSILLKQSGSPGISSTEPL